MKLGVALQKPPVRLETPEDVLARVEAVDADDDLLIGLDVQAGAVLIHGGSAQSLEVRYVDGNRVRPCCGALAAVFDFSAALPDLGPVAEVGTAGREEVLYVFVGLESDRVVRKQTVANVTHHC